MGFKPKLRALIVNLTSGEKLTVHEPRLMDIGAFLRCLPALEQLRKAFQNAEAAEQGIMGLSTEISIDTLNGIKPLFDIMMEDEDRITVEDFAQLGLWDGMSLLEAFWGFAPKKTKETPET